MGIKKEILFVVVTMVLLTVATPSSAELIAHYTFDSQADGATPDSIGNSEAVLGDRVVINTDAGQAKVGVGALEMLGWDTTAGSPASGAVSSNLFFWEDSVALTMTFWVKSTGTRTTQGTFTSLGDNSSYGTRVEVKERAIVPQNSLLLEINGAETGTNPSIEDGDWHFVAIVVPDEAMLADIEIYVDGSTTDLNSSSNTTAVDTQVGPLVFGDSVISAAVATDRTPRAMIDDFQLYNNALSLDKIQTLYENPGFAFLPPIINSYDSMMTSLELLPLTLSATITGNNNPVAIVDFTLMKDDIEFPDGANARVTNTTTDNQNPTATLTTDTAGTYKVRLEISDGITIRQEIAEIMVYDDACQAQKQSPSGWTANYFDLDGNCLVDILDFAEFAAQWLDDTGLENQETFQPAGFIPVIPVSVFDARIEAESVDSNKVSNSPLTDTDGIRIISDEFATGGGEALGYTSTNAYAEYMINIPAAGTYDLYLSTAAHSSNADNALNFGTVAEPALYGSITDLPATGWDDYYYTEHPGALTFTAAGSTKVRITWYLHRNLDWFAIVQQ